MVKSIGLAYRNGRTSHSVMCSLKHKIDRDFGDNKLYDSNKFSELSDKEFFLFNLNIGKSRGVKKRMRDYFGLNKVYILDEDFDFAQNIFGDDEDFDSKFIKINTSRFQSLTNELKYISHSKPLLSDVLFVKILYDINFDFKDTKDTLKYSYTSYERLLTEGDAAIEEVVVDGFTDFMRNNIVYTNKYIDKELFDSKKEVYERALASIDSYIHANKQTIKYYDSMIKKVKEDAIKLKEDKKTLEQLINLKFSE